MTEIVFDAKKYGWDPEKKVFNMHEGQVRFDTTYEIINPRTGGRMKFEFSHSTGPEFNPMTRWIYYNLDKSISLEVSNDPEITRRAAEAYMKGKLGK